MAIPSVSLSGWGDIAQIVIAVTAIFAFIGAAIELHLMRANARRTLAYSYAERLKQSEQIRCALEWRQYWREHSDYADFKALEIGKSAEWLAIVNLIEEIGALYDRKLVDRDVTAETLGVHFENLWTDCADVFVIGVRQAHSNDWLYDYWEQMQRDTVDRRRAAKRRLSRRRAWRKVFLRR